MSAGDHAHRQHYPSCKHPPPILGPPARSPRPSPRPPATNPSRSHARGQESSDRPDGGDKIGPITPAAQTLPARDPTPTATARHSGPPQSRRQRPVHREAHDKIEVTTPLRNLNTLTRRSETPASTNLQNSKPLRISRRRLLLSAGSSDAPRACFRPGDEDLWPRRRSPATSAEPRFRA
jgi:hypothetical protein